jgi:hypothetical protein
MCGIRQSVCRELRQLDRGFFGVGLPHPGVESFATQVSKLPTHYGCRSGLGIHMQVSMELLFIEEGFCVRYYLSPIHNMEDGACIVGCSHCGKRWIYLSFGWKFGEFHSSLLERAMVG